MAFLVAGAMVLLVSSDILAPVNEALGSTGTTPMNLNMVAVPTATGMSCSFSTLAVEPSSVQAMRDNEDQDDKVERGGRVKVAKSAWPDGGVSGTNDNAPPHRRPIILNNVNASYHDIASAMLGQSRGDLWRTARRVPINTAWPHPPPDGQPSRPWHSWW